MICGISFDGDMSGLARIMAMKMGEKVTPSLIIFSMSFYDTIIREIVEINDLG